MENVEISSPERRRFLRAVPVAAAAGFVLSDLSLFGLPAAGQGAGQGGSSPEFEVFTDSRVQEDVKATQADSSQKPLYTCPTLSMYIQSEGANEGKEFEYHEGRDHVIQILDGETTYEVGGKPQNAHSPKPGEWLAPKSEGASTFEMKKGDVLVLRRGTPHKRITKKSVTFMLIAPMTT